MENNENQITDQNSHEEKNEETIKKKKKFRKGKICFIIILLLLLIAGSCLYLFRDKLGIGTSKTNTPEVVKPEEVYSAYRMSGNELQSFDLSFLQLENEETNKIYSPLSIKYALEMLAEGANGNSKAQINGVIGDYKAKKYVNSSNISFANAMFIKDLYKDSVKSSYTNNLSSKYNADVIYDSFATADVLNHWVSDKTFGLVNNLFDSIADKNFVLVNALAIDMEWKNVFQQAHKDYYVSYPHERYSSFVSSLENGYRSLDFNNSAMKAKSVQLAATANKYDIVNTLGEASIRETVGKEYEAWLARGACGREEPDVNTYLDQYIKELNTGYKQISSSTDFYFYDDDSVKVFAKDLKEYDGTTLQYVGIMPKEEALTQYITNTNASNITTLIHSLKTIELDNFKEGVITEVKGSIPLFKIDYELKLMDDLKALGITDVFDITKADLTGITPTKDLFIDSAVHKANIEFSNEGIKAAAATALGGKGSTSCGFNYYFDVPVEVIDLSFDKPYLYFVRDKDSGEVWFAGTVYEPVQYELPY